MNVSDSNSAPSFYCVGVASWRASVCPTVIGCFSSSFRSFDKWILQVFLCSNLHRSLISLLFSNSCIAHGALSMLYLTRQLTSVDRTVECVIFNDSPLEWASARFWEAGLIWSPFRCFVSLTLQAFLRSHPHQIDISLQFATAVLHTVRFRCITLSANVHMGSTPYIFWFSLILLSIERVRAFGEAWFISSPFRLAFRRTECNIFVLYIKQLIYRSSL